MCLGPLQVYGLQVLNAGERRPDLKSTQSVAGIIMAGGGSPTGTPLLVSGPGHRQRGTLVADAAVKKRARIHLFHSSIPIHSFIHQDDLFYLIISIIRMNIRASIHSITAYNMNFNQFKFQQG